MNEAELGGARTPLFRGVRLRRRENGTWHTVIVIGTVGICGILSLTLAWFGSAEEALSSTTTSALVEEKTTERSPEDMFLPVKSLDFSMGILLRLLALVAVVLAVVEIELPPWISGRRRRMIHPDDASESGRTKLLVEEPHPSTASSLLAKAESGLLIVAYMAASIGIVYMNAYILKKWPYAATLTMVQMIFCSVASHLCVLAGLSDPSKVGMTKKLYATICVPLAVLYTFYLYGSNAVYSYLPVGYIQLLKPAQAIFVYVLLAFAGCETVSWAPVLNLVVILGSVVIASVAQSEIAGWSTIGFVLMMISNVAYACYLVGQQLMLNTRLGGGDGAVTKSVKMDSISTLYFLGPATAVGLGIVALFSEWRNPDFTLRGIPDLLLVIDCFIAFSLNLIQIRIIGKLSALTYMFSGYVKGFLTVGISWVFYHEAVDSLEIGGYVVMLFGQLLWSLRKLRNRQIEDTEETGPTVKVNATFATVAVTLFLVYAVAGHPCALLPCRD